MPREPHDRNARRYRRFFGPDARRDVDDELAFHFAMRAEELRRAGLSTEDAEEAAMKRFGDVDAVRSEIEGLAVRRQARRRWSAWAGTLRRDTWFALRTLRKSPAFTLTAILTIALGIGASTAIFSVVNAVLLRPLPYAQPERLAFIWTDVRARNVVDGLLSPGDLPDVIEQVPAFESIATIVNTRMTFVGDDGHPDFVAVALVTQNFFRMIGTRIPVGRDFTVDDSRPLPPPRMPGDTTIGAKMIVLSYEFWQRRFGGDTAVLGRTFMMSNSLMQVVGIAPRGFHIIMPTSTSLGGQPEVYQAARNNYAAASRVNMSLRTFGRLAPGATMATAQRQLDRLSADLRARFPAKQSSDIHLRAAPMQADLVKAVRPAILSLMGAVLFVLLIACANVANLLLVRASTRERELAIRSALGGTRGNLVAQILVECLVLSLGGALLGVALAAVGVRVLPAIAPADLPRLGDVSIDLRVLGFATLAAVVSALVFGLVPAERASRPSLLAILRSGRTPGLGGGTRLRQAFVVVEVALSFALLVGAGLMVRSFVALAHVDPGFDPRNTIAFTAYNAGTRGYDEGAAYASALADRLAAIPGVTGVTAAMPLPLDGLSADVRWGPISAAGDASQYQQATRYAVRAGFFAAMRTRVLAGHDFTPAENFRGNRVVVIDELLAAKAFPGKRPDEVIGQSILAQVNTPEPQPYQVIGVVEHQRYETLMGEEQPAFYAGAGTLLNPANASRWVVRTDGDLDALAREIPRAVADVAPTVPVVDLKPMTAYIDRVMAPTRFALVLIGIFGVVALVLAAIGLYGVVSTTVRQRTAEIGVRIAFGASDSAIFRLIVGQGVLVSFAGIGAGLVAALALTGMMSRAGMLVAVRATDPLTYVAIAVVFALVAAVACWRPARRAARLDPMVALRDS